MRMQREMIHRSSALLEMTLCGAGRIASIDVKEGAAPRHGWGQPSPLEVEGWPAVKHQPEHSGVEVHRGVQVGGLDRHVEKMTDEHAEGPFCGDGVTGRASNGQGQ